MKLAVGVVVTALALFVFGFLWWAMGYVRHELPESSVPDLAEMLKGFVHYLLVAGVLALLLERGATLGANVRRAALIGLAAVVVVKGSDVVWWGYPLGWTLLGAVYHVLLFVLGALTLGKFLPQAAARDGKPGKADAEGQGRQ